MSHTLYRKPTCLLFFIGLFVLATNNLFASSTTTGARITGIYSNLVMSSEDVTGIEVFIVLAKDGYFGVIQFGEGTPTVPVVVPIAVSGNRIRFSVGMPTGLTGDFQGNITSKGLVGKFEGEGEIFTLPRKQSLWQ